MFETLRPLEKPSNSIGYSRMKLTKIDYEFEVHIHIYIYECVIWEDRNKDKHYERNLMDTIKIIIHTAKRVTRS